MASILPYPGMDFTALDVLHASDLDKMVANIELLGTFTNVNVTPASNFSLHSSYGCKVYKIGRILWLVGALTASANVSATNTNVCTIPSGYRTQDYHYGICSVSGNAIFRYTNNQNGIIQVQALTITSGQNVFLNEVFFLTSQICYLFRSVATIGHRTMPIWAF